MFEDDGTARTKLLTHLGFTLPVQEKDDTVQEDLSQEVSAVRLDDAVEANTEQKESTLFPLDNGEDFFNNLPSPKADTPVSTAGDTSMESAVPNAAETHVETDGLDESYDPSFDDSVQRALVVGDYKGAVEQCIAANKMADALVIAHVGGAALWESTRDKYLKAHRTPYLKVAESSVFVNFSLHCLHMSVSSDIVSY